MPVSAEIHDLSFFSVARLKDMKSGDVFWLDDRLVKRFQLNNYQCLGVLSGEQAFLFSDINQGSSRAWSEKKVLVLRDGLKARIVPDQASPQDWIYIKQGKDLAGLLLLRDSGSGISMSGADDRTGLITPGRVSLSVLGDSGEFHDYDYLWAVENWRIEWMDGDRVVLSLTKTPD